MTATQTREPAGSAPTTAGSLPHRPRMLELYSCAGVGGEGLHEYFDVTAVDIDDQPHYPQTGTFIKADVMDLDPAWIRDNFDIVGSSPPCQRYCNLKHRYVTNDHPDLIGPTRELLLAAGLPFYIENVDAPAARAELIDPIKLCGTMFPGLRVIRHRLFEAHGFDLPQPFHPKCRDIRCHTLDKRKNHYGKTNEWTDFVQVTGGGNSTVAAARDAMGIPHRTELTKQELNEGIPPAYTRYIAAAMLAGLKQGVPA